MPKNAKHLIVIILTVAIGALLAWAGSSGSSDSGFPLFALIVALAFVIQWAMYLHSWFTKTEKFFDLTGSLTYIALTVVALAATPTLDARSWVLGAIVIVWAGRLGTYLFTRIVGSGGDDRFDEIKKSWSHLLVVWTLQGLWVTFTALAAWITITSANKESFGWIGALGLVLWVIGFAFEVIADYQKSQFRKDPANKGEFIHTGLWAISRHPNYFGEIVMWTGVFVIAAPVLVGWQWVAVLSPVFVALLLIRVSGIPMLEAKADKRWGDRADYQEYKAKTPVLVPGVKISRR